MRLVIFNTTVSTITYLSGAVSITASGSTSVTNTAQQLALATDGALRSDLLLNNVYITDGTNNFGSNDAIDYLYELIQFLGPTSDSSGNPVASVNSQLQARDVINTAGQYRAQSVTTSAAEALGAASILVNRKFISLTPTNGTIYWGFSNAVTTSSGTPIFKNQTYTIAATDNVHVYVIAGSTVDCRISEGS
jgi:hypothetical protein